MDKDIERILFNEEVLKKAVSEVGKRISDDFRGKNPLLVGILKGSAVFFADLIRTIDIHCEIDFMTAKSYGTEAVSSGNVRIIKDIDADIKGRDVILVEDILESARTLYEVKKHLEEKSPSSVRICTLLNKKADRVYEVLPDYKCFDIENEFVVGYGLDYAEKYRNLPYIGVLKRKIYEK